VAATPARQAELVRALGYWAALWSPGPAPGPEAGRGVDDVPFAIVLAAADAAGRYLSRPTIIHLHGVTAAMAVSLLVRHTDEATAAAALGQVEAEHAALFGCTEPVVVTSAPDLAAATMVDAAVASGEAHAVKLIEACDRGFTASGDPVFLAASERVVRRSLRALARPGTA
jgi:hypothetical protein